MDQNQVSIYSNSVVRVSSSDDINERRRDERRAEAIERFFELSTIAVGGYIAAHAISEMDLSPSRTTFLNASVGGSESSWSGLKSRYSKNTHLSDIFTEAAIRAEELSPLKIVRTLQVSHLLTPFAMGSKADVTFTHKDIESQGKYFRTIIGDAFDPEKARNGMRLTGGRLHYLDSSGKTGDVALSSAKLMLTHHKSALGDSENKIFKHLKYSIGMKPSAVVSDIENDAERYAARPQVSVYGTNSKLKTTADIAKGYGRYIFYRGVEVFDNPISETTQWLPWQDSKGTSLIKRITNIGFGTEGDYTQSVPRGLGVMLKNFGYKSAALGFAYAAADYGIRQAVSEDSAFSKGLIPGIATAGVNMHIKYAEVVSDPLQGYKQWQEDIAPGSTNLFTLAGVPLELGLLGGTLAYGMRMYDTATKGVADAEISASEMKPTWKANGKESARLGRFTKRGMAIGGILMAPFFIGASAGSTSEELRAMYSGESDVAIRKDRWWLTGATRYEGEKISYFDKHWYAKLMAGTSTKSIYGDQETKDSLNPWLNPFDYLRDPYRLEKLTEDERPYPVWGMDVSWGSFLGKAFEKTIGRMIKPDVINPELEKYLSKENTTKLGERGEYKIDTPVSAVDKSLIDDGILLSPESPVYAPEMASLRYVKESVSDFVGLYGWILGLAVDEGLKLDLSMHDSSLSRSGEITNSARSFQELNIGGAFGLTEPQRRMLPTSAQITEERKNPLLNNMPSWLPGDDSEFYINFSRGNAYGKIQHGESRLPGRGYESLHSELEGVSPEDYSLAHKFSILSGVASGSKEYYFAKNEIEKAYRANLLTEKEKSLYISTKNNEIEKGKTKEFYDKRSSEDLDGMSIGEKLVSKVWDTIAFNSESPTDNLTFFRPAGSLMHHRTAVDDYKKTQVTSTDMAIWTSPYSHFIKPTLNSFRTIVDDNFIPKEVERKRNIDEYFNQLKYLKYRNLYLDAEGDGNSSLAAKYKGEYQKTIPGVLTSGIDSESEILRAYISLPKNDRPYFAAFVQAEDSERESILDVLPTPVAEVYKTLWKRKDTAEGLIGEGATFRDVSKALTEQVRQEDLELESDNPDDYKKYVSEVEDKNATTFREYITDSRVIQDIELRTGVPGKGFIGWDPRIDLDLIKIRTLSVGDEDIHNFGFWKSNKIEMERYTGVLDDQTVTRSLDQIAESIKKKKSLEDNLLSELNKKGYNMNYIRVTEGGNSLNMNIEYED